MSARTIDHPVFVRAREAARARTDLRMSRMPQPVTRLSNAPVLLRERASMVGTPDGARVHLKLHPPAPSPETPPDRPPAPPPAAPDVIDLPPAEKPQPITEPPASVQARRPDTLRRPGAPA